MGLGPSISGLRQAKSRKTEVSDVTGEGFCCTALLGPSINWTHVQCWLDSSHTTPKPLSLRLMLIVLLEGRAPPSSQLRAQSGRWKSLVGQWVSDPGSEMPPSNLGKGLYRGGASQVTLCYQPLTGHLLQEKTASLALPWLSMLQRLQAGKSMRPAVSVSSQGWTFSRFQGHPQIPRRVGISVPMILFQSAHN